MYSIHNLDMKYTTKVWFGCTTKELLNHLVYYKGIREHLISRNCILLFDWLEDAERRIRTNPGGSRDIKRIFKDVLSAIDQCDVTIIENTIPNYSVTHQIVHSLAMRKPTLVLWQKKDNDSFDDSYLEAVESKYLTIKQYKGDEYKKIIDEFLGISKIEFGQRRYNVVLDNKQKYYLDWVSKKYKKSRSSIIRDAIDAVSSKDEDYISQIVK